MDLTPDRSTIRITQNIVAANPPVQPPVPPEDEREDWDEEDDGRHHDGPPIGEVQYDIEWDGRGWSVTVEVYADGTFEYQRSGDSGEFKGHGQVANPQQFLAQLKAQEVAYKQAHANLEKLISASLTGGEL